jgi:hypothetical protein
VGAVDEPAGTANDQRLGRSGRRAAQTAAATARRSSHPTLGYPGMALMIAGAVLLLVSFTSVNWYAGTTGADGVSDIGFNDLHQNLASFNAPGASTAYFGWIAWVLLIAAILVGLGANLPSRACDGLRVVGLAVGLAGAAWTYYALAQYIQALRDRGVDSGVFNHAQAGVWLALAGYLLAAAGAVIGPLPVRWDVTRSRV